MSYRELLSIEMVGTANEQLVFVRHSSADTWVAQQIAHGIKRSGAKAFLDEADVDVGEEFEDRIAVSLDQAHELLVLVTPWSLTRPYIWAEIGAAWIRKIPIIVVLHGLSNMEFQSLPNVPVFLKKRDLISLNDVDN